MSINRKIFNAAVIVGGLSLIVKSAAAARELIAASWFGRGDVMDAFFVALAIPQASIHAFGSSFGMAFVPLYIQDRAKNPDDSEHILFREAHAKLIVILIGCSVLIGALGALLLPILLTGFNPQKLELTKNLLFCLLPILPLGGLCAFYANVLNAHEKFVSPAMSPILVHLTAIIMLFAFGGEIHIYALALGVTFGFLAQFLVMAKACLHAGLPILPSFGGTTVPKLIYDRYIPLIGGSILMISSTIIDSIMASALDSGSVAALGYGMKVTAFFSDIASIALGTVVFPYFSRLVADRNLLQLKRFALKCITTIFLLTVPLVCVLIYGSHLLVELIFERGAFTPHDTEVVSEIQAIMAIQLPIYLGSVMFARALPALGKNWTMMGITVVGAILNITLNYIFMKSMGVNGIALSTVCVYTVSFLLLGFFTLRELK